MSHPEQIEPTVGMVAVGRPTCELTLGLAGVAARWQVPLVTLTD